MGGFAGSAIVVLTIFGSAGGSVGSPGNNSIVFIKGCSINEKCFFFTLKFKENDIAFLKDKACNQGLLRKIAIKRIVINHGRNASGFQTYPSAKLVPIYFDTFNACYMESELLTKKEAVACATSFYEKQIADTQKAIDSFGCN